MDSLLQWTIPIIVGILTFFAGRVFERYKLAQENRLKLLEPIEEWVNGASRLVGIIGDDVLAVTFGLTSPTTYSQFDRLNITKSLTENKTRVFGILMSKALNTRETRQLSTKLTDLMVKLSARIEQGYLQSDVRLLDNMNLNQDTTAEVMCLLSTTSAINEIIQEIHSCLAEMKIRFN